MYAKRTVVAVVLAALVVASAGAAPLAAAQDDDSPPPPPAAYYGEVTLNGDPAPAGTTITAVVDGEERGSITVSEAGQYGGPNVGDEKLQVNGTSADDGATVTFLVDGVEADQTVAWSAGDHREVNLTAEGDPDPGDGEGPPSGGGGAPPGDGDGAPPEDGDDGDGDDGDEDDDGEGPPDEIPAANVSASETVEIADDDPDSPGVTVSFPDTAVSAITFDGEFAPGDHGGNVTVSEVEALPGAIDSPPGQVVAAVEIAVPDELRNQSATIAFDVDRAAVEELDADEEDLAVARFNESAGEWQQLETSVVASEGGTLTLEATTPGFSYFAATAQQQSTATATPEPVTATPGDGDADGTPTESDPGPGSSGELAGLDVGPIVLFGALLGLVLLGALAVARRRSG